MVSLAIVFVGSVALARSLGPVDRGAQGFLVAATILLAAVFGGSGSIGGYVLATRTDVDRGLLAVNATWFGILAGLLAMVAMMGVEVAFGALPAEIAALPLWPLAILVAVAGFVMNSHETQLAFAAGRSIAGATLAFAPYTLAAIGYAVAYLVARGNLAIAVWTFALAPTVVSLVARRLDRGLGARLGLPHPATFRGSMRQGARSYIGELAALLHQRIDVILLGLLSGSAAVGIYVVGYQMVEPILALSAASGAAILALGHGDPSIERGDATIRLVRQTATLGTVAAVGAFILAPILIPAIYGAEFVASVDPLRILAVGLVGLAIGRIGTTDLLRRNMLGRMAAISSTALVINVGLNLLLIPRLGPVGAACSSLVSYWSHATMSLVVVRRASGFAWRSLLPRPLELLEVVRRGAARGSAFRWR